VVDDIAPFVRAEARRRSPEGVGPRGVLGAGRLNVNE